MKFFEGLLVNYFVIMHKPSLKQMHTDKAVKVD